MWIAVGAPFLGAPKAVRGTVTGDRLGLDTFVTETEGLLWGRSLGSTPWLFPNSKLVYPNDNYEAIMSRTDETLHSQTPLYRFVPLSQILAESGANNCKTWHENYYLNNPLFGNAMGYETVLSAPPIDRLVHIYGVNVETEVITFVKKDNETLVTPFIVDLAAKDPHGYYVVKDGIAYETANTKQRIATMLGQQELFIAGDGTVPYASLAYCKFWNGVDNLKVECRELEGEKHREILNSNTFFSVLLGYLMAPKGTVVNSTVVYPPSVLQPEALAHWKNVATTLKSTSSPHLCFDNSPNTTVNYPQNNYQPPHTQYNAYQNQYPQQQYTSYLNQFQPPPLPSYSSNPDLYRNGNNNNNFAPQTNHYEPQAYIQQYATPPLPNYVSPTPPSPIPNYASNPDLSAGYHTPPVQYSTPNHYSYDSQFNVANNYQYQQPVQPAAQFPNSQQPQYYQY